MVTARRALWVGVLLAGLTRALDSAGQRPGFEVASIRPSQDGARTSMIVSPSGITYTSVSLSNCLEAAYGVTPYQISGPRWLRTEQYDIAARAGGTTGHEQIMAMLQTLLADRFQLAFHRERKDLRVLGLVVAKSGPRLSPSDASRERSTAGVPGGIRFQSASMPDLGQYLSRQGPIGVPVVDATGLAGRFDFDFLLLRGSSKQPGEVEEGKRSIRDGGSTPFADALEDLGLKLEPRRLPMDILVVDRAQRIPTDN